VQTERRNWPLSGSLAAPFAQSKSERRIAVKMRRQRGVPQNGLAARWTAVRRKEVKKTIRPKESLQRPAGLQAEE
jgi:hypothetical protein